MVATRKLRRILFAYVVAVGLTCIWVPRRVTYYQPEQLGPFWCGYSFLWHPLDKYGPLASNHGPMLRTYSVDYLVFSLEDVGLTGLLVVLLLLAGEPSPEATMDVPPVAAPTEAKIRGASENGPSGGGKDT